MNKDKDKITSDGRENLLLRFLGGLALLAVLMMLTAGSCDKKKTDGGGGGGGGQNPENKIVPCSERGFTVTVANDNFANAFKVGNFSKDANGAFNAEVTVTLSALTRANGFVSNHVWINPSEEKFNGYSFQDKGKLPAAANDGTEPLFADGETTASNPSTIFDGVLCSIGVNDAQADSVLATAKAAGNANKYNLHYTVAKAATSGTAFVKGGLLDSLYGAVGSKTDTCKDVPHYGYIIEPKSTGAGADLKITGKAPIGAYGPINATSGTDVIPVGDVMKAYIDEKYEADMKESGAYYIRDNGGHKYTKAAEQPDPFTALTGDSVPLNELWTTEAVVHKNDTDALYDEIVLAFEGAGVAMAGIADVFTTASNMGAESQFLRQPAAKDADNVTTPFSQPQATEALATDGKIVADGAGTSANGGWQKLFTISPCDETMKNGFAVAYTHTNDANLKTWLKEPTFTVDGVAASAALPTTTAKSVVMRPGTKASGNDNAWLFESLVSEDATAAASLGFFTVQHTATINTVSEVHTATMTDLTEEKNALTTKGSLVCRSALALQDTTGDTIVKGKDAVDKLSKAGTGKATLETYKNTVIGYKDGEVKTASKGLGLTCYLGLTALWPDAIDGSPKAEAVYKAQFKTAETDRKVADQFDVSSKYLSLLMVNIPEDIAINNELLKPYFLTQFSNDGADNTIGAQNKVEASESHTKGGKKFLADIKADANETKIDYITGSLKVSFTK